MGIASTKGFKLPAFRLFWRRMGSFADGKFVRRNFLKETSCIQSVLDEFVARVSIIVSDGRGGRPFEAMHLAISQDPALTLSGRVPNLGSEATLIRWELVWDLNKKLARASGGSSRDFALLRREVESGLFDLLDGVELKNPLGIAWCTLGSRIDNCNSKGYTVGRVCEMLGLRHLCWGPVLEFKYAVTFPALLRIPTTLDSSASPDFRSSKARDLTGYARDMKTGRKGLPELVHRGFQLDRSHVIVSYIGDV